MTFGQRLTTVTQDEILPQVVDTILGGNFITFRVLSNGKKWTGEHTEALVKMMSSPAFYADMEGVRGLLLRHKTGLWGFSTGPGDTYKGAGGWSRDEAINMIKSAVGSLRTFAAPPKKD